MNVPGKEWSPRPLLFSFLITLIALDMTRCSLPKRLFQLLGICLEHRAVFHLA